MRAWCSAIRPRAGGVLVLVGWVALVACPSAVAEPTPYDAVAGELVRALEPTWDARLERYDPGRGGSTTGVSPSASGRPPPGGSSV